MRMLSSIFRRLVEWGLGGVVAGVVAGIIPVGCDGLPRVVSRWSGLSRGQRVFLQDRGGQEAGAVCLTEPVGPESCSVRSAGGR